MVERYPHTVTITWKTEPVKDEETGNYTPGGPQTIESECKAVPNGLGRKIMGADGNMVEFSFEVFMPLQTQSAPFGSSTVITIGSNEIKGSLKRMFNYQMFTKLWV